MSGICVFVCYFALIIGVLNIQVQSILSNPVLDTNNLVKDLGTQSIVENTSRTNVHTETISQDTRTKNVLSKDREKNYFSKKNDKDSQVLQDHHHHHCSHIAPKPENITHMWFDSLDDFLNVNSTNTRIRRANNFEKLANETSSEARIPLKIKIFYDRSVDLLESEKYELIKNKVMPTVVDFFRDALTIRRRDALQRYRIRRRCPQNVVIYMPTGDGTSRPYCLDRCEDYATCGEVVVPRSHLAACSYCDALGCRTDRSSEGDGVGGSQFLLYVSAEQTSRCRRDQTIAYAAHCAQDLRTDRPIAGHANLCPGSISTDPKDLSALIATVKHELTHVLGFSVSLFAYYRDENGRPLTERNKDNGRIAVNPDTGYPRWSERTIKRIVRTNWQTASGPMNKTAHLVVTPTVRQAVREHFNCSELLGAELEDQGSDGTSMTHWEKRLFENEAMTGTHTQNSAYTRITLAMLQDTGWYVANFSRADPLEWGKNLGCNFAEQSCKSWIDNRRAKNESIRPFCDEPKGEILHVSCTDDRASKAVCNMKAYDEPLNPIFRNFDYIQGVSSSDLSHYGGSVDLADYCPFIQEFTWQARNVTVRGSRCEFEANNIDHDRNAALEQYGQQSKCFEHARRWEQRSCVSRRHWHHYGAGCYKYTCADGHLSIIVQNETYPCFAENDIVRVDLLTDSWLHSGTIVCPACHRVCHPSQCYLENLITQASHISLEDLENFISTDSSLSIGWFLEYFKSSLQGEHLPSIDEMPSSTKETPIIDRKLFLSSKEASLTDNLNFSSINVDKNESNELREAKRLQIVEQIKIKMKEIQNYKTKKGKYASSFSVAKHRLTCGANSILLSDQSNVKWSLVFLVIIPSIFVILSQLFLTQFRIQTYVD